MGSLGVLSIGLSVRDRRRPDRVGRTRAESENKGRCEGETIADQRDRRGETHRFQVDGRQRPENKIAQIRQGRVAIGFRVVVVMIVRRIGVKDVRGKAQRPQQEKRGERDDETESTRRSPCHLSQPAPCFFSCARQRILFPLATSIDAALALRWCADVLGWPEYLVHARRTDFYNVARGLHLTQCFNGSAPLFDGGGHTGKKRRMRLPRKPWSRLTDAQGYTLCRTLSSHEGS